jgi:hypothetical protein
MNTEHDDAHNEELDVLLSAAAQELLDRLRATTGLTHTLLKLMATDTTTPLRSSPSEPGYPHAPEVSPAANIIIARAHARELARELARALTLISVRPRARELASALDLARTFASVLDFTSALTLASACDRALLLARVLDRARELAKVRELARVGISAVARDLDKIQIDVSGVDLHQLDLPDLDVLTGVVWTEDTTWPPEVADQVRARSDEIQPGVYQVRGGTERGKATFATT